MTAKFQTHSILMTAETVASTLAGLKSQTRRVIISRRDPLVALFDDEDLNEKGFALFDTKAVHAKPIRCRYGKAGDRLIVKETFYAFGKWKKDGITKTGKQKYRFVDYTLKDTRAGFYLYAVDSAKPIYPLGTRSDIEKGKFAWWKRPAMFMPYRASRITLEVLEVRAERLQDISEADCLAEGVTPKKGESYCKAYRRLWDAINKLRGFEWKTNPWVFVITFKRLVHEI